MHLLRFNRDNYGFVTYVQPSGACKAVEGKTA